MTILANIGTCIDGHYTMIDNIIIAIAVTFFRGFPIFLAAGVAAAIQRHSAIVENSCSLVGYIVHCAGAGNGQLTAQSNINGVSRCFCVISQRIAAQIKAYFFLAGITTFSVKSAINVMLVSPASRAAAIVA